MARQKKPGALRRCPVSRGYTQRAEPPLEGVAATLNIVKMTKKFTI